MTTQSWILSYLGNLVFWLWVLLWGGAEWLEGTFSSGFLINYFAINWSADQIKVYGWLVLFLTTVGFIAGIFVPQLRGVI